jgi:hypothetical protein
LVERSANRIAPPDREASYAAKRRRVTPRHPQQGMEAAGLEPIAPHEARHCAISYFIAAGLD